MVRHFRLGLVLCVCFLWSGLWGVNLYPEGDFERTGNTTVHRSGAKSLTHRMDVPKYYVAQGHCQLQVEPYAVYEATGYVKGRIPTGYGQALAFYGWDSFGWCFMSQVRLPREIAEWRRVSTRFSVPVPVVDFSPLVLSDSKGGELWIDDVSVVKVQDGGSHLRALETKSSPSSAELQLLARSYLDRGQTDRALALREHASAVVRADITCQVALRSKDVKDCFRHTVELLKQDCLQWADGKKRVTELLGRLPLDMGLAACLQALESTFTARVADCLDCLSPVPSSGMSVHERRARLRLLEEALAGFRALESGKGVRLAAVGRLAGRVGEARRSLQELEQVMGRCQVRLSGHGIDSSETVIVLPDAPSPSEEQAARELALNLELLTGTLLECVPESRAVQDRRHPIFIGRNPRLPQLGIDVDYGHLGQDGIHVENGVKGLVLAGGQRGVLYAVYDFLEERLGFRWFTPDCSAWPKRGTFALGSFKKVYVPALKMRATDYYAYASRLPFSVQNRYNSLCTQDSEAFGGNIHYQGFVHTMNWLLPVERYGSTHPEYYALRHGMRKVDEHSQPCLTNPEVLKIVTDEALRWCARAPRAQIISISQNDNSNYCQCERCMALAAKEGSQMGPLLHFVNAVAREIGKRYPEKVVDTLAYQYTRKAPKHVRPERNVAIRLCSIECCFVHPLAICPFNKTFVDDIVSWSKICRRLHIWDYVINYAHCIQPFPNLRVLQPNIQFFIDHGVTGIYEEANYFSRGAEMAELRIYLMGKLLWNPKTDVDVAIREFTDAYFGAAGGPIREYLKLLHDTVCTPADRHVTIYASTASYLNDERLLSRSFQLFSEAERAVSGDAVRLRRVRNAKLPLLYTSLSLKGSAMHLRGNRLACAGGDGAGMLEEFAGICRAEKVTHVGEGQHRMVQPWIDRHRVMARSSEVLTLENEQLRLDILPGFGGRIWRLMLRPEGRQLLRVQGDDAHGYTIHDGGMEWYSTEGHGGPGWSEAYTVVERGKDHAVLSVSLGNGRSMTRRISLLEGRPCFKVDTRVTRTGGDEKVVFRCHPEFLVSSTSHAELQWKVKSGAWRTRSLANPKAPMAEQDLWLRGELLPAGEWGVLDRKTGIRLVNRFQPAQVGSCFCNWNGAQRRVNLELWSMPARLPAGQSASMDVEYEIQRAD